MISCSRWLTYSLVYWIIVASSRADGLSLPLPEQSQREFDAATIQQLLEQLGDDSFQTREAAHAELRVIGDAAVGEIRIATKHEDVEIKERALRLLKEITHDIRSNAVAHFALKGIALTAKTRSVHVPSGTDVDAELKWLSYFPTIESVAVEKGVITANGLDSLMQWPNLHHVSLEGTCIPEKGIDPLPSLPSLTGLNLSHSNFSCASMAQLAKCTQLKSLGLAGTNMNDDAIAKLTSLRHLGWLNLSETNVTGRGLKHLDGLKGTITFLDLSGTRIEDIDLAQLAEFDSLEILRVNQTAISGFGFAHLESLPKLRRIELDDSSATDDGIKQLHKLRALRSVSLRLTDVSPRGVWLLEQEIKNRVEWSPRHETYEEALNLRRDP